MTTKERKMSGDMNNNIKQVIVVRTDLNMRKGKMCAQVAHASTKVFFDRMWTPKWQSEEDCELCNWETDCKMQNWSKRTPEEDKDVYPNSNPCLAYKTNVYYTNFTTEMIKWKNGSFAKIVVGCNSEQELFDLQKQAEEEGIVNALILDNGNTEFKQDCPECKGYGQLLSGFSHIQQIPCERCNETGKINKQTYTCLAIGPDLSDKIDKITGGLKLL